MGSYAHPPPCTVVSCQIALVKYRNVVVQYFDDSTFFFQFLLKISLSSHVKHEKTALGVRRKKVYSNLIMLPPAYFSLRSSEIEL